ncbi:hypothetical protein HE1_01044 [Holospora elegans E1]|uniref:Transposase n=1 Tax=Holospora elegans E1 TaxID=1427503 RepID=A0A023E005_9PROT|nr:hypothetical protein [Holospora elegans]GAJ46705.1 hypothetical protein HE1_01044 [Holospora elegans E1]
MKVTAAGCKVFDKAGIKYPALKGVRADAGYRKKFEEFVQNMLKKSVELSTRITPGWAILAKRWGVERTFVWLNHFRRLAKEYEIGIQPAKHNVMPPIQCY